MMFFHFPSIEQLHHIRKSVETYPDILNGNSKVKYQGKIKLHGTNAGIQIHKDGTIIAQSREQIITVGDDNKGFARWCQENTNELKKYKPNSIIFGEWAGNGINKGAAVCQIPHKIFAVFASHSLDEMNDDFDINPEPLNIKNTYMLPFYSDIIEIDWSLSNDQLKSVIDQINSMVANVEKCDPWVKDHFDISGIGEGLVFVPISKEHLGRKAYSNLTFKAKGEKHKVIKTKEAVQLHPEVAKSINDFVDLVLTEARLEQGASTTSQILDIKLTGKFIEWILQDVEKETQDELEASGLTFEQVNKFVGIKARNWYIGKVKGKL